MDRPTLDGFDALAELAVKPRGYLPGRLVRESENANTSRIKIALLDEEPDALDQAKSFSSARAGAHE
jgi:hypothetical protein